MAEGTWQIESRTNLDEMAAAGVYLGEVIPTTVYVNPVTGQRVVCSGGVTTEIDPDGREVMIGCSI